MTIIIILSLILGMVFLVKGADMLISGTSSLGRRLGVSDMVIGLTVVAFGTSLPEFFINITSAISGSTDLAFGNIMGSNISNILLILGLGVMVTPFRVPLRTKTREIPFALVASLALLFLGLDTYFQQGANIISRSDGLVLLLFLGIFLVYMYYMAHADQSKNQVTQVETPGQIFSRWKLGIFIVAGLGLLIAGGTLVVESAVVIASKIGLSETIIGLTIVAVGTSLPELVSTVVAARSGFAGIALGNIIGSNIFNILLILATTSIIHPVSIPDGGIVDMMIAVIATILIWVFTFFGRGEKISRKEGAVLVLVYIAYICYRVFL